MLPSLTVNQRAVDPTATLSLRNQYAAAMRGRFNKLRQEMVRYISSDWQSIQAMGDLAFMAWVNVRTELYILGVQERQGNGTIVRHEEWQRRYTEAAFIRGAAFADRMLTGLGITTAPLRILGMRPYQTEIDVILAQSFADLRGVTEEMARQIQRELIRGILEGLGSREIGERLADRVDRIGRTRGETIARTEVIRAFAEASLTRYQIHGIGQVGAQVEFLSAGDSRVCLQCQGLNGQVFSIAEARGILPVHPRCRCAWLPLIEIRRIVSPLPTQIGAMI